MDIRSIITAFFGVLPDPSRTPLPSCLPPHSSKDVSITMTRVVPDGFGDAGSALNFAGISEKVLLLSTRSYCSALSGVFTSSNTECYPLSASDKLYAEISSRKPHNIFEGPVPALLGNAYTGSLD